MIPCVIIPTYNEAKTIGELVKQIRGQDLPVIVIDDGSQDNTSKVAQDNGAVILKNERNFGKGASLIKGFDYALNKDFDAVIILDGDGQHEASDIPFFCASLNILIAEFLLATGCLNLKICLG